MPAGGMCSNESGMESNRTFIRTCPYCSDANPAGAGRTEQSEASGRYFTPAGAGKTLGFPEKAFRLVFDGRASSQHAISGYYSTRWALDRWFVPGKPDQSHGGSMAIKFLYIADGSDDSRRFQLIERLKASGIVTAVGYVQKLDGHTAVTIPD